MPADHVSGMKLARTLEQWACCDPRAMTQQSPAAMEFAFQDAKHDIRVLAAATAALQDVLASIQEALEDNDINGAMLMVKTLRAALAKGAPK